MSDFIVLTRPVPAAAPDLEAPLSRVENQLAALTVALRTDEGLVCFDASGVMTGEAVRNALRGWSTDRVSHPGNAVAAGDG